jgi:hypothetical protein
MLILVRTAVLPTVIQYTRPYKPCVQIFRIPYCADHRAVLYCTVPYYGRGILYGYTTGHTDNMQQRKGGVRIREQRLGLPWRVGNLDQRIAQKSGLSFRSNFAGLQSTPLNPRVDPPSGSTIHSTRLVG